MRQTVFAVVILGSLVAGCLGGPTPRLEKYLIVIEHVESRHDAPNKTFIASFVLGNRGAEPLQAWRIRATIDYQIHGNNHGENFDSDSSSVTIAPGEHHEFLFSMRAPNGFPAQTPIQVSFGYDQTWKGYDWANYTDISYTNDCITTAANHSLVQDWTGLCDPWHDIISNWQLQVRVRLRSELPPPELWEEWDIEKWMREYPYPTDKKELLVPLRDFVLAYDGTPDRRHILAPW